MSIIGKQEVDSQLSPTPSLSMYLYFTFYIIQIWTNELRRKSTHFLEDARGESLANCLQAIFKPWLGTKSNSSTQEQI